MVFVDECSTSIALTRGRARAKRGEGASGRVPRNWGQPTSLVAAWSVEGLGEAMTLEGAFDTPGFTLFMERFLAPSLQAGQVVVLDNLSVHKANAVRELVEARGCVLLPLPAYSADSSPIEQCFSKIKAALRRSAARTQTALDDAISEALKLVTREDALGWFRHCGYLASPT